MAKKKKVIKSNRSVATTSIPRPVIQESIIQEPQDIPEPIQESLKADLDSPTVKSNNKTHLFRIQIDHYVKDQLSKKEMIDKDLTVPKMSLNSKMEGILMDLIQKFPLESNKDTYESNDIERHLHKMYLLLEKMNFTPEWIRKSLTATKGLGVFEWICLNVPLEQIPSGFYDKMEYEEKDPLLFVSNASLDSPQRTESESFQDVVKDDVLKSQEIPRKDNEKNSIHLSSDLKSRILASLEWMVSFNPI